MRRKWDAAAARSFTAEEGVLFSVSFSACRVLTRVSSSETRALSVVNITRH